MPRFGFSKDDEDGKKASLFSRKKSSGNTNQDDNPYAQQSQQADPYAAPMTSLQRQQASMGLPVGPRGGRGGLPSGPGPRAGGPPPPRGGPNDTPAPYGAPPGPGAYGGSPANGPPSSYGGPPPNNQPSQKSNGYSAGGYGASGGYGSNKYDSAPSYGSGPPLGRPPTYRSTADSDGPGSGGSGGYGGGGGGGAARLSARRGGYGGMGGRPEEEVDDSSRQALFGDAPQKYAERRQEASSKYPNPADGAGGGYGANGDANTDAGDGYGEKLELTAEEQEDEDVKRMNQETRYLRNETDQSLDRSLMIANQSIETARSTMARMYNQRERLLNVESNLDEAANHNKIAEHRAAELKHYNRSMFAVKVNNPFTSKQRAAQHAQSAIDEHRSEREQREETRRLAYLSNRNAEQNFEQLERATDQNRRLGQTKSGISSKFNLEDDDEEDIQKEQAIDQKMGLLAGAVGTLNMTARAMNEFATEDLDHIDRIAGKVCHPMLIFLLLRLCFKC